MYVPTGGITLDVATEQQIRLGIQGYFGTGKTYAALTFPNPVVLDIDRGLGAHIGRKDVIQLPFFNFDFCKKINPNHKGKETLKDTIMLWMDKEANKLEHDQTLIIDGSTGLQNAYHFWYSQNPVHTKQGQEDAFAQWRLKKDFFSDIHERFKTLKCHVVYICHEFEKPDAQGSSTGKIRPLMTGQFANEIGSHYTDWVRQHASSKPKDEKIDDTMLKRWGKTKSEFLEMLSMFPRETMYYWQLESDDIFDGKVSSLKSFPKFIPANYNAFKVLMNK